MSVHTLGDHRMSYDEALECMTQNACKHVLETVGRTSTSDGLDSHQDCNDQSEVPLLYAVGYKSLHTLYAPHSTPHDDTSAMDGFAVDASKTANACRDNPLELRIIGSIAAGGTCRYETNVEIVALDLDTVCVEIMTGARFPQVMLPHLDSVVKIEDVTIIERPSKGDLTVEKYICLSRPVKAFQNRRPAGSDFVEGDVIIEQGMTVEPKHVAALASLRYDRIAVQGRYQCKELSGASTKAKVVMNVGVLSTGSEIVHGSGRVGQLDRDGEPTAQSVPDSNGPYLVSALRSTCSSIAVEYLGIIQDDIEQLTERLREAIFEDSFDMVLTSGGVSKGKHDLVRYVIETRLKGRVIFHGVKVRPGAPILFASFERQQSGKVNPDSRTIAFFGVPGNPLAAAVALRFFIVPYILSAVSSTRRSPIERKSNKSCRAGDEVSVLSSGEGGEGDSRTLAGLKPSYPKPRGITVFWLGKQRVGDARNVDIVDDQASYKLRGLLQADCWITIPAHVSEVNDGDQLVCSHL